MKYIFRNKNDVFNGNYPWLNGLSDLHATNVNKTWKFNTSYTCCGLSEIGNIQHKCNYTNFEFLNANTSSLLFAFLNASASDKFLPKGIYDSFHNQVESVSIYTANIVP